ncbi:TB2/DP1, HVA22 family domain-containing protein [Ditylenchus destructor]|nr:TB2/DP1, HVA22 family domain-containing protein [Ditylenchus destructor]
MHEYGLLNVSCAFVSIFLPCIETFRAIKSRNLDELEFVAKYWIVFGVWNSLEAAGNLFYLTRLVPAYSFLKFVAFSCIYLFGHDLSFELMCPFIDESEPLGAQIVQFANGVAPVINQVFSYVSSRVIAAIVRWHESANMKNASSNPPLKSLASMQHQSLTGKRSASVREQASSATLLGIPPNKPPPRRSLSARPLNHQSEETKDLINSKNVKKGSCVTS